MFDPQRQTVLKFHEMVRFVSSTFALITDAQQLTKDDDLVKFISERVSGLKIPTEVLEIDHSDVAKILALLPTEAEIEAMRSEAKTVIDKLKIELEARGELIRNMEYMLMFYMQQKISREETNKPLESAIQAIKLGMPFGA